MAILGLLLLLAVAGLAVDVAVQNTSSVSVEAVGATFSISPGWLFVAGLATGVIGMVGLGLFVVGVTRARRRRATLAESRTSLQGLQAERDRLAVELERERARRADEGIAAGNDDSAVIDLADERRSAPASADAIAVERTAGQEPAADEHEPVGTGRHGLFPRRR